MLDGSSILVLVLSLATAGLAGFGAARLAITSLHRRAYSLECAVADLEDKLLIEIKRRAGTESGKSRKRDQELFDGLTNAAPPARQPMWWEQFVDPSLKRDA